jgi:hypothetical protein
MNLCFCFITICMLILTHTFDEDNLIDVKRCVLVNEKLGVIIDTVIHYQKLKKRDNSPEIEVYKLDSRDENDTFKVMISCIPIDYIEKNRSYFTQKLIKGCFKRKGYDILIFSNKIIDYFFYNTGKNENFEYLVNVEKYEEWYEFWDILVWHYGYIGGEFKFLNYSY